ncbi:MAG TPA: AI-2E family transporter [Pseudomonadota bacterium]|nr:AI-2E family transporter [Pseudomonadota bacterium]
MESGSRLSAYHHLVVATSATVALCYFGRLVILPALLGVAAALLLAPAVDVLARFRIPRWLSAFFLLFVALFLAYAASHLLYGLLARFFEELPHHAAKFERVFLLLRERIDQVVASTRFFAAPPQPVVHVSQPVDWPKLLLGSANSVGEFLFTSSFVPFITYFLLTWQDHLHRATVQLFDPAQKEDAERTLSEIAQMMRSVLWGNVLVGLLIGVLSSGLFGVLGVPYFYLLGMVSGLLSMVPYLGFVLALVPPLLIGLGDLTAGKAVVLMIGVLLLHLLAINLLVPKLIGQRVQVNPLAATLSLLLWGVLWGGIGLLLAVPIVAAAKIVCDHIEPLQPLGQWLGDDRKPFKASRSA